MPVVTPRPPVDSTHLPHFCIFRPLHTPQTSQPEYAIRAKGFLTHWNFVSELYIRDLTLRSSKSFGSFHLLRLLIDEYMKYLVESATHGDTLVPPQSQQQQVQSQSVHTEGNGASQAPATGAVAPHTGEKRISEPPQDPALCPDSKRLCGGSPAQQCTGLA